MAGQSSQVISPGVNPAGSLTRSKQSVNCAGLWGQCLHSCFPSIMKAHVDSYCDFSTKAKLDPDRHQGRALASDWPEKELHLLRPAQRHPLAPSRHHRPPSPCLPCSLSLQYRLSPPGVFSNFSNYSSARPLLSHFPLVTSSLVSSLFH